MDYETAKRRLRDRDPKVRFQIATELRDRIEIFQANAELSKFLQHLFPVFEEVLKGQLYVLYLSRVHFMTISLSLHLKVSIHVSISLLNSSLADRYGQDRTVPEYENLDSKCRNVLLETLHRLPNSDALKDYVIRLLRLSMEVGEKSS